MRHNRMLVLVAAALGCLILTLLAIGPAQATSARSSHAVRSIVMRMPAAPAATPGALMPAATNASPQTSPAASYVYTPAGGSVTCQPGNLCTAVYDPTKGEYKVFFLSICARYALSYWNGTGVFTDNQTGGVRSYFYNSSGGIITSFVPVIVNRTYDWTPVWSIRNC